MPASRMLLLLAILLTPVVAFAAYLTFYQTRFILPAHVNPIDIAEIKIPFEPLVLPTPSGETLHGVLFPAESKTNTTLILAFPGNTHNAVSFAYFLKSKVFPEETVAVAALSYRGYPNGVTPPSSGTPSQKAMFEDALLIHDTLTQRLHPTHVKVAAYSIGTAVATHLALNRPIEKMALVAPLASIRRIVQEKHPWLPVRLLLNHPFATEDTIGHLNTPTTFIYTPTDGLVPARHVEQILHTANPAIPLVKVEGATHNSLALDPRLPALIRTALGF